MVVNKTEQQEKQHLRHILTVFREIIKEAGSPVDEHMETLNEYKAYLWENREIDVQEKRSMRESILNLYAMGENVIVKSVRLGKLLDIPYFGRIDSMRQRSDVMAGYILDLAQVQYRIPITAGNRNLLRREICNMLNMAVTRAMHKLSLTSASGITDLIG